MPAAREILASGSELEVARLDYRVGDGTAPHVHDCEQAGWVPSGRFLERIAEHLINRIDELLPWHLDNAKASDQRAA